jgi:histone-lysine N-methyltransferase SETMAR
LWYRSFKDGRDSDQSDRLSRKNSTSKTTENVESVTPAINENRRLTMQELEDVGIPQTILSHILTEDLGKKRVAAKFLPRLPTRQQKEFRAELAQDSLETANNDPDFIKKVITGDESWVFGYDPKTKAQVSKCNSPESPRPKVGKVGATSRSS